MKKYLTFVKENMEEVKQNIANTVAKQETSEKDIEKMDIAEKPNEDINKSVEDTINKFESQKKVISDKIEFFNKQIENINKQLELSQSPEDKEKVQKQLDDANETISKLDEEMKKFDELISTSQKQQASLKITEK
jgi:chromosome segregation ATPase